MPPAAWLLLALLASATADFISPLGTIHVQGVIDEKVERLDDEEELVIPAGQCSGLVLEEDYRCFGGQLLTVRVEVRDEFGPPHSVWLPADLSSVTVRRDVCKAAATIVIARACTYTPPTPDPGLEPPVATDAPPAAPDAADQRPVRAAVETLVRQARAVPTRRVRFVRPAPDHVLVK